MTNMGSSKVQKFKSSTLKLSNLQTLKLSNRKDKTMGIAKVLAKAAKTKGLKKLAKTKTLKKVAKPLKKVCKNCCP